MPLSLESLPLPVLLGAAAGAGLLLGALLAWLGMQRRLIALRARIDAMKLVESERDRAFTEARRQLADSFSALSGEALRRNSESFLRLAESKLQHLERESEHRLGERQRAVEALVAPIREALDKTREQIQAVERSRHEAYGSLGRHLETMTRDQQSLRAETANLVKALRRPEVRGRWGEMTLRRLVELAGMVEHCDFHEQVSQDGDSGRRRPDMVVSLPNGRSLIIDAKSPLDAYVDAVEAVEDDARRAALTRHARQLRRQVQQLADKSYWQQCPGTPDFVVLFIPGDHFLSAALDQDAALLEDALRQQIILATPTTLVALLRAVAHGWREERLAANAAEIRQLGEQLQTRLARFTDHLTKLGRSLGSSVDHYNRAVGSLQRQVMPSARRFSELGVDGGHEPAAPEPLPQRPRESEVE
jgi:DNA recombination protein RmuC